MKKALSLLLAVLLMMSLFSFTSASAEARNLLPITEENFVDSGYGAWIPAFAQSGMLGKSGGIYRLGNDVEGITRDVENVKYGDFSFKFERGESENSEVVFPLATGYLTPGKTYTFQAYVKTQKLLSANSGAFVGLSCKAVVPEYRMVDDIQLSSEAVVGTKDWTLIYVSFTMPEDPDTIVIPNLGVYGAFSGTAWFDGIALVEGDSPVRDFESLVATEIEIEEPTVAPGAEGVANLLTICEENIGIYNHASTEAIAINVGFPGAGCWAGVPGIEGADPTKNGMISYDTETVKYGEKSIKIAPSKDATCIMVKYMLRASDFEAGKTYTYQAYIKTNRLLATQTGAGISIEVYTETHGATDFENISSEAVTGTKDWTLLSLTFKMPEATYNGENTVVCFNVLAWTSISGSVWFDGLAVVEGSAPVKDYESLVSVSDKPAEPTPAPVAPTLNGEPSAWAKEEIIKALEADLVPEHVNSAYTTDITRSDFCDLIIKMIEKKSGKAIADVIAGYADAKADVSFPDTDSANVIAAAKLGIVNGRSSGAFDPTANITRQEAAKMLALAAKVLGADITASEVAFADADSIYAWAKEFIYYVNTIGVMNGTSTTTPPNFSPLRTYTREQSILTVYRLFNAI